MKRWAVVLLWSVIAAAFVGPGTVTTAAAAGARYGLALLWTLGFSLVACWVLQEAAARLAIQSGLPLGEALRARFSGPSGWLVRGLALGAIVLGCAAFQVGNILGAVAGLELALAVSGLPLAIAVALCSGLLLWIGTIATLTRLLGALVAFMGVAFFLTAWRVHPPDWTWLKGLLWPALPSGAEALAVGLVGTTVVPYNLFLGSRLARGQDLGLTRLGLAVSIAVGVFISMAILVTGSAISGAFSYRALAEALASQLGPWARTLFALGLFAAGFSSALTAPTAAAITARGILARNPARWTERSAPYRAVLFGVWAVGVLFGLLGVRPIPAILAAQALNGVLLPIAAVFLWLSANDPALMGPARNGLWANALTALIVSVATMLGLQHVLSAARTAGLWALSEAASVRIAGLMALLVTALACWKLLSRRNRP
ncbi:MAG: divalent metal cation transporter [Bacteroidetes bacterium]|nr:divalent metal cation transporter [Rhodothermia bacterium]MCS7155324.1 divalent metal cation transporter [Bacteroidota bacterium]MCX7907583.1 divalent metal cation transporter [Bacteroidota bacterium]MDW8138577.1 divalent metal cation transporter [Bacteroidota bacterium]MDW8284486.1 divalent metal cation transporter [Bacteroidota bacterium]